MPLAVILSPPYNFRTKIYLGSENLGEEKGQSKGHDLYHQFKSMSNLMLFNDLYTIMPFNKSYLLTFCPPSVQILCLHPINCQIYTNITYYACCQSLSKTINKKGFH